MENNTQFNHTLPDHVGVTLAGSCTYLGSGSSDWTPDAWIQSRKSLINMGDSSWHDPFREQVALGLNGSEFTASDQFGFIYPDGLWTGTSIGTSISRCEAYKAGLNPGTFKPVFHADFVENVANLKPTNESLYNFVHTYGTHYVISMLMGGVSTYTLEMDTHVMRNLTNQGCNIGAAVALGTIKDQSRATSPVTHITRII